MLACRSTFRSHAAAFFRIGEPKAYLLHHARFLCLRRLHDRYRVVAIGHGSTRVTAHVQATFSPSATSGWCSDSNSEEISS